MYATIPKQLFTAPRTLWMIAYGRVYTQTYYRALRTRCFVTRCEKYLRDCATHCRLPDSLLCPVGAETCPGQVGLLEGIFQVVRLNRGDF